MWIFGYGSLLWYQDFPYVRSVPGIVKGYSRRFWQLSPDHRGTPEKPGRTVTIIPDAKGHCWGIAYKVPEKDVIPTRAYLDHREKAGYSCVKVWFEPDDVQEASFEVEVYMSYGNDNEHHAGPSDIEDIARTVIESHGPSGPNIEYVIRLADILHKQAPHSPDEHVFALEKRVLELSKQTGKGADVLKRLGFLI